MAHSLNPLVLLNISDQVTRAQVQNISGSLAGIILGTKSVAGDYHIGHSLPRTGDYNVLSARLDQYRVIHPDFEVIGIYSVAGQASEADLVTLATILRLSDLLHLQIHPENPQAPYSLTACVVANAKLTPGERADLRTTPCACGKVVISDLSRTETRGGDWDLQLQNEMAIFERAKATFNEKIGNLIKYAELAAQGKVEVDAELLVEIGNLKAEFESGVISRDVHNEVCVEAIARMALAMKRSAQVSEKPSRAGGFFESSRATKMRTSR